MTSRKTRWMARQLPVWLTCGVVSCTSVDISQRKDTTVDNSLVRIEDGDTYLAAEPPYIGVAISGGGNRSAIYAAYVMELLSTLPVRTNAQGKTDSFMDTVQYISSVSGGGFAASYYAVHKQDYPVSGPSWDDKKKYFFESFHRSMNKDWESALAWRLIGSALIQSPAGALDKKLNEDFLQGKTFADLEALEKTGKSPVIIFNSTHYDTGRRFVMTNLPTQAFALPVDTLVASLAKLNYVQASQPGKLSTLAYQQELTSVHSLALQTYEATYTTSKDEPRNNLVPDGFDALKGPGSIALEYKSMPISRAVAASGAFPMVGPLSLTVRGLDGTALPEYTYTHLIDGGVTDNSGVESLAQLFLRELEHRSKAHALVVMIDASLPFREDSPSFKNKTEPLAILLSDPARLSDEQGERADFYRNVLWGLAGGNSDMTPGTENNSVSRTKIIVMRHTDLFDPREAKGLGILLNRHALGKNQTIQLRGCPAYSRDEARKFVAGIPTRYALGQCEESWLRLAACSSVLKNAAAIANFYEMDKGTTLHHLEPDGEVEARASALCPELR
ncbi:TPA: patatin-like phospholipase family protein [Burkholderia vietnamiensis]|nr:patatin-like phospholipase family protein [Burkholderia vietnamiensis]